MQVIILGDVHLGAGTSIGKLGLGSNLNSRITDQLNLLNWTLDKVIDLCCNNIIITGDVFEDPKPSSQLITLFISWLKTCESHSVNVHIIAGNHDFLRSGNFYTSPLDIVTECEISGVNIYKNIDTITLGTSAFTLVPFRDKKSFQVASNSEALKLLQDSFVYELASIPETYNKVMVGHLALEGSLPVENEIDDLTNELFCNLDILKGYDFVWMGHVHSPQILCRKPHVAHIGSMDISNFGETKQKKHIVIYDTNGSFYTEELPTRNLQKICINVPEDSDAEYVLDFLKHKTIKDSIVKLEIVSNNPINRAKIEKFILSEGVFNVASISETRPAKKIIKSEKQLKMDVDVEIGSAINKYAEQYVTEEQKQNFLELALEIYSEYKAI